MLKSILPLPSFRGFILCKRLAHGPKEPSNKDTFKEKGRAEENRYFVKEHAEKTRNLREYLKRIEECQRKLKLDMDETSRLIRELQEEENEAAEKAKAEEERKK